MELEDIARVIEAAFQGFGCYHYTEESPGVFSIGFDDYHTLDNVTDMVKIMDSSIEVSEHSDRGIYYAILQKKDEVFLPYE